MDVCLICVDASPQYLWTADIDRICGVVVRAMGGARKLDSGHSKQKDPRIVVPKQHPRRTVSKFYLLASHDHVQDIGQIMYADQALQLPADALTLWNVDLPRWCNGTKTRDEAAHYLLRQFDQFPVDEHVMFYFPASITAKQKTQFDQIVEISLVEKTNHDSGSDDGCGFRLVDGPHGSVTPSTTAKAIVWHWGVWSDNTNDHEISRAGGLRTHRAVMYSLWICWRSDDARFKLTHGGLHDSVHWPPVKDMVIPDDANFWYAMENFPYCFGRESCRSVWDRIDGERVGLIASTAE